MRGGEYMFKFFHISDVHFDIPLTSKKEDIRVGLKNSQKLSFKNAIELCIKEKVNGLLISGDLFDNERVSLNTEKFLHENFDLLKEKNIPVFYAPGNHDPSLYMKTKFSSNVNIFDRDDPLEFIIKDKDDNECRIIGVGHLNNNEKRNLIKKFPIKKDKIVTIGVAHTMVENVEADETKGKYMPTSINDLVEKKYDYWALGHIHKRMDLKDDKIYYSGNIQGLNINETGLKGGNLIKINENTTEVSFVPLNSIYFHKILLDISGEYDTELDFYNKVKKLVKEDIVKVEFNNVDMIVRISFIGKTNMSKYIKREENIKYFEEELSRDLDLKSIEIKINGVKSIMDMKQLVLDNNVVEEILELIDNPKFDDKFLKSLEEIKFQVFDDQKDVSELIEQNIDEIKEYLISYFTGDDE